MKKLFNISTTKRAISILLALNLLVVAWVISYHYHDINIVSENSRNLTDSNSYSDQSRYSYYDCPIIQFSSTAFQTDIQENTSSLSFESSEIYILSIQSLVPQNSEINYNLRAPPFVV